MNDIEWIVKKLNEASLKGLEEFPVGDVLRLGINLYEKEGKLKQHSTIDVILRCCYFCVFNHTHFYIRGNGETLFFFGRDQGSVRMDHLRRLKKASQLLKNVSFSYGRRNGKLHGKSVLLMFRNLFYVFMWKKKLCQVIRDRNMVLWLLHRLSEGFNSYCETMHALDKQKIIIKNLVISIDCHVSAQMIIRHMTSVGVCSIEFMEGLPLDFSKDNSFGRIAIPPLADCLVSYGEYASKNRLSTLKEGVYPKGIYNIGPFEFIGKTKKRILTGKNSICVGVFTDGIFGVDEKKKSFLKQTNLEMIRMTLDACSGKNYSVYIKCHPGADVQEIEYYKSNIDTNLIEGIYARERDSEELIEKTSVVVLRETSCLIECLYLDVPVIIYGKKPLLRDDIPFDIYFNNGKEELHLIEEIVRGEFNERIAEMKEYMCGVGDVTQNYRDFFRKLGCELQEE